ncbi:PREDICTED: probable plastid-lipid-associated protein 12, chloroplastic isoform X2 [Camelina sativa]|uniref:Probable plastid-lipid-associated protein 12, chloroplastic isoform X2 n=1 Tax=Camelina sativa TaxID=90675 RepID=A0ABM0X2D1_CAMSA|nr:PREDICTED: probable plastid-lipid-associated protein 12, chloroplastic isoform X2 [Camelina sativa]
MVALRFYTVVEMSLPCLCPCPSSSPISLSSSSPRYHLRNTAKRRLDSSRNCRTLRISCSSSSTVTDQTEQSSFNDAEMKLIDALIGIQGRGKSASPRQLNDVESAVKVLEGLEGIQNPTDSDLIEGRWRLMFTTRPGTASPIQRTFTGVDVFTVFQDVYLKTTNDPRVSNIVRFSDIIGELKVEAAASIKDGKRVLFRFDKAAFSLKFLPFKVPYPVPFRLLGDEAKGWLDTTYLSPSGNLRISRGNKGTTFVLQKETVPRQKLLATISKDKGVAEAIDEFLASNSNPVEDDYELLEGSWQMIWSSQMFTDSWIENAANGLMGRQIIDKDGRIKFEVNIIPAFRFSMKGKFIRKSESSTYDLKMDDAAIIGGAFGYPVDITNKIELKILYADEKMRISRGFDNIIFVHIREI